MEPSITTRIIILACVFFYIAIFRVSLWFADKLNSDCAIIIVGIIFYFNSNFIIFICMKKTRQKQPEIFIPNEVCEQLARICDLAGVEISNHWATAIPLSAKIIEIKKVESQRCWQMAFFCAKRIWLPLKDYCVVLGWLKFNRKLLNG